MASKELIEKVGLIVYKAQRHNSNHEHAATEILSYVLAALQETTPAMQLVVSANWGRRTWAEYQQVLNASPLGEQSE